MKEFVLGLPDGTDELVKVEERSESISVEFKGKSFRFTKGDLLRNSLLVARRDGQIYVSGPSVQRAFSFQARAQRAGKGTGASERLLQALFPGRVVKILAKEGAWAEGGELLLVMESMKMEYHYQAPGRILVEKILVKEGEVLPKGKEFFSYHG